MLFRPVKRLLSSSLWIGNGFQVNPFHLLEEPRSELQSNWIGSLPWHLHYRPETITEYWTDGVELGDAGGDN
jgi:hypothetical protein